MEKWRSALAIYKDPFPDDTERMRVVGLRDFVQKYPTYLESMTRDEREDLLAQASTRFPEAGVNGPFTDGMGRTLSSLGPEEDTVYGFSECEPQQQRNYNDMQMVVKRFKRYNNENKWNLYTTLELLESMKAYVMRHQVSRVGVAIRKWMEVAMSLENPRGIELQRFARSCQVRYDNIRRYLNEGQDERLDESIRRSVIEYLQICHQYADVEQLRLKSQNKAYRYRRQTRFAYSNEVLQMYKMKALSQSVNKEFRTPERWRRNRGGEIDDYDEFSVLVPSENSELESDSGSEDGLQMSRSGYPPGYPLGRASLQESQRGSNEGVDWRSRAKGKQKMGYEEMAQGMDWEGRSRGKRKIADEESQRNPGAGGESGDDFDPNFDVLIDSILLGKGPPRVKEEQRLGESGDNFNPNLEGVIQTILDGHSA